MHLQRIELQGFKTFATRTAIELPRGVTAVVGPNGSGKSNIADAVRWALGETNLRQVRCRGTEELIFAGGGRRSSLGMAEVSLVFANEGGWLDLPFSEVRVSRRAYRSGENEYLLNGTRVRLRDVVDLLSGASLHAGGHVVIGQGMVDAVLSQRAEERRLLVENLAGLKHYYLRRDDAEARLGTTEDNLTQVDAMIAELAPQVASLAAQAEALRAYRAAEAELRALQRATFSAQAARALTRETEAAQTASRAAAELAAARTRVAQTRAESEALAAAAGQERARLETLREQLRRETATQEALRRDAAVAAAQLAAAEETQQTAAAELTLLVERVEQARAKHRDAEQAQAVARGGIQTAELATAERRRERQRLVQERDAALVAHRDAESAAAEAERRAAHAGNERALLAIRLEGLAEEIQRQQRQREPAERALTGVEQALAAASESLRDARQAQDSARRQEVEAHAGSRAAQEVAAAREQALQQARRRSHELETRLSVLQELQEQHDGYDGPARAMARHPAALGLVADVLRVPPRYQAALALALGPLLEAVVTADPSAILAARARPGEEGQLRMVIVDPGRAGGDEIGDSRPPGQAGLAAAQAAQQVVATLPHEERVGWAIDLVDACDVPSLPRALRLDRTLVVRDAVVVLRWWHTLRYAQITMVSADGELAGYPDGSLAHGMPTRLT
ncbi:MAG TPA: AAA family ATPase, partial [Chloroflexota bacterium]|nr:AAA family ATPase [Chloroflexota bacterium]